jgi:arsenate reductase
MAEAFLNRYCREEFEAHSAGLEPGKLDPIVVEAMQEIGIDISRNETKAISDVVKSGKGFTYVITLCDQMTSERCPIFPGVNKHLHWPFRDPSVYQGSHEYKLTCTREIRDAIKAKIEEWCAQVCPGGPQRSGKGKPARSDTGDSNPRNLLASFRVPPLPVGQHPVVRPRLRG